MKYILVSGGVLSGIGKGVIASSTGVLLKALGFRVTSIKIDPYINIDAGTMSPFEHGEVFVLDDGGEVDLDLGNYERFIGLCLTKDNNITTGKIYNHVIEKERRGEFLGKTVQVVPHITDAIQTWIQKVAHTPVDGQSIAPDICVIELGGTIGDIESMPFVEAMRQFQFRVGKDNFCSIHVSLVPVLGANSEQKTKPTQQSVRELRALGISPDIIICRSTKPLDESVKQKISSFCHTSPQNVLSCYDVSNLYRVPLMLQPQGLSNLILSKLHLIHPGDVGLMKQWQKLADKFDLLSNPSLPPITIAVVGKYTGLADAYHSLIKALQHASMKVKARLQLEWIESTNLDPKSKKTDPNQYEAAWKILQSANGILVPGGFGDRGIEGKVIAINYARTKKIPFLGICLGMQMAVIEIARNDLHWEDANSTEFDEHTTHPVVIFMPEISKTHMGGTMRLGKRTTVIKDPSSNICKLYGGAQTIAERHRHRYEVNPELVPEIEAKTNMRFIGQDETGKRMEIIDMQDHPYFVGVQYHPEYLSRPFNPSPPFVGLVAAAAGKLEHFLNKKEAKRTKQNGEHSLKRKWECT